ncbi:MAG: hypothetical protein V3V33_11065 [Candidatus Lokiarchaeia archaeon]
MENYESRIQKEAIRDIKTYLGLLKEDFFSQLIFSWPNRLKGVMENVDYEIVPNEENKVLILLKTNERMVLIYGEFIDKKLVIHGYSKSVLKKSTS